MVASAPGKLVLIGEYAVLEGAPSLVAAVDRYARVVASRGHSLAHARENDARGNFNAGGDVNATANDDARLPTMPIHTVRIRAPEVGVDATIDRGGSISADLQKRLALVLPKLAELPDVTGLVIDTSGFYLGADKMGLGSSAAVTVALAKLASPRANADDLFETARADHKNFQNGMGSGIDLAASVNGGVVLYRLDGDRAYRKPVRWPQGLSMIAVWSGAPADTREFLKNVAQFAASEPSTYTQLMQKCTHIATDACAVFERGDVAAFLETIDAYAAALANLGRAARIPIITPEHEHAAAIARSVGARYKSAGAGGGDLGTALCRTEDETAVLEALSAANCTVVPLGLAEFGARLDQI
ncbi:MAG: hypothetical protein H7Z43_11835 [Clostridia bacterium]|nr:hypothetical protein [Deltaproteobacteria bacterium]